MLSRINCDNLKVVVDSIPDMIWLKDAEGRFLLINAALADACGLAASDVVGKTDHDIWPAELADKYMADDREVVLTGKRHTVEEQYLDATGELRWIETVKSPLTDKDGRVFALTGIARDITRRKQVEAALELMNREFTTMLENTTDLVYFKDHECRFRFCSQSVAKVSGVNTWHDLVGKHDRELFPPELVARYSEDEQRIFEEGRPLLDRVEPFSDCHGRNIWLHTNKWPIFDRDHRRVVGIFGISRDITERKNSEEEIRKLNQELSSYAAELEGANQDLEAFSYSLTHDLRKPLTIISGYCQSILEIWGDGLEDECTGFIEGIHQATLRMNQMINAVLRLALVKLGELKLENVDLSAIAEKVAEELQLTEKERRVEFVIPPGINAIGDRSMLLVVMENLLGNAWKYTGNEPEGRIELGAEERDGVPTYYIRDNGIGFDQAQAERIFIPFHRLDEAAAFKGTGIGLATVARIIKRHGGRIWTESEPGKGATFFFQLTG